MPRIPGSSMQRNKMIASGSGSSGPEKSLEGRIGSPTPARSLSKDMTVDKNPKGNAYWAKRQAASKAAAAKENRLHADPVNSRTPHLKRVKPD
jgi:hypothetical protein